MIAVHSMLMRLILCTSAFAAASSAPLMKKLNAE